MQSIGMIETKGLIASIESADIMLKTADVKLVSKTIVGGGLVTITIEGDVAAVKASIDAAVSAVERLGRELLISNHVIPRPIDDIKELFQEKKKIAENKEELQEDISKLQKETVIENTVETDEIISDIVETISEINDIEDSADNDINSKDDIEVYIIEEVITQDLEDDEKEELKKFDIKTIDKKNFKKEELEKIYREFDKQTALKVLESLNISELRKLSKEYADDIQGINISKLTKSKLISKIMSLIE